MSFILGFTIRIISWTYKTKIIDPQGYTSPNHTTPFIWALWHNRIMFLPPLLPSHVRKKSVVLISSSHDGEYATNFAKHFSISVIRGSSSRNGAKALRNLLKNLNQARCVALTLDGPRGPKYTVQKGAIFLAQMSKLEIVPITMNAPNRWQLNSWDNTIIPKPFSSVTIKIGTPLSNKELKQFNSREKLCQDLKNKMLAITQD